MNAACSARISWNFAPHQRGCCIAAAAGLFSDGLVGGKAKPVTIAHEMPQERVQDPLMGGGDWPLVMAFLLMFGVIFVLPGHRPRLLGGFCVSKASFLQKSYTIGRGANHALRITPACREFRDSSRVLTDTPERPRSCYSARMRRKANPNNVVQRQICETLAVRSGIWFIWPL
jgi:hypothetical protein